MRCSSRSVCRCAAAAVNLVFGIARRLGAGPLPVSRAGKLLDAIVDIPFALPTAVAGIALTNLYAENGWLGGLLAPLGIKVAFTPLGIFVALVFIGLPFVVRTVQPVLEDLEKELEEAAASLGASRWTMLRRVVLPSILPALLTGFALAFARAVGEYGSVIFIAGQPAERLGDRAAAHRHPAAGIPLRRRHRDRRRHAGRLLLCCCSSSTRLQRWSEARTGRRA